MLSLEPVVISNKKFVEEIGHQVVKVFMSSEVVSCEKKEVPHEQRFSRDDLEAVALEGVRRGVELSLWKFVAALDKCESVPESDFMREVLRNTAMKEAMRGTSS